MVREGKKYKEITGTIRRGNCEQTIFSQFLFQPNNYNSFIPFLSSHPKSCKSSTHFLVLSLTFLVLEVGGVIFMFFFNVQCVPDCTFYLLLAKI